MNRLYVLVSDTLDPIYGAVQGGHCVAQWLLEHPQQKWNNEYLIYLQGNLKIWKDVLDCKGIDYSKFQEPDLNMQTTAIATLNPGSLFNKLQILGAG